jgi:hypothetical protein
MIFFFGVARAPSPEKVWFEIQLDQRFPNIRVESEVVSGHALRHAGEMRFVSGHAFRHAVIIAK